MRMIDRLLSGLAAIGLSLVGCSGQPSPGEVARDVGPDKDIAEADSSRDTTLPSQTRAGTFWPGMILINEAGYPEIHIPAKRDPSQAVPALVFFLEHRDAGIRRSAAQWLGAIGGEASDSIPALEKSLEDPSPAVREAAADAIKRIESAHSPNPG